MCISILLSSVDDDGKNKCIGKYTPKKIGFADVLVPKDKLKELQEKFSHCDYIVVEVDENTLRFTSIATKYAR